MAYNLATTELSTIFLTADDPLSQEPMNKKFRLLLENDKIINQLFSNAIGIWECFWYYDSSIKGYSIGDAVWLNTEDPNEFVKLHADAIRQYTRLNSQILDKLPEFDSRDDAIVNQYKAAMSGYTDISLGQGVKLPPIFDIGDFSKPIQLAISLKNNNKALLSDSTAWKTLFVDSESDSDRIRSIISKKEAYVLDKHLKDYHFAGNESSVQAKLSNYIDVPLNTLYSYTTFPSSWQSKYNESNAKPSHGMDYVLFSIRKPYMSSGAISQYQAMRYWNSGLLEHFGTISTKDPLFVSSDGKTITIPFNWLIANDNSGAKVYEAGELAKSIDELLSATETSSNVVPPQDNLINVLYTKSSVNVGGSTRAKPFADGNYNVTVNAIYQDQNGLEDSYIPATYGDSGIVQNWNSNYLTNEVLNRKNRQSFTMKAETRVLPPYISYYAVGKGVA